MISLSLTTSCLRNLGEPIDIQVSQGRDVDVNRHWCTSALRLGGPQVFLQLCNASLASSQCLQKWALLNSEPTVVVKTTAQRKRVDFVNGFGVNVVVDYHEQTISTLCNDTGNGLLQPGFLGVRKLSRAFEQPVPFSAKDSMHVMVATTVKETQAPLRTTVSFFGKFGEFELRRGGTPVRSRRCKRVLGFTLALDVNWLHSFVTRLKAKCVVRLLTGHSTENTCNRSIFSI